MMLTRCILPPSPEVGRAHELLRAGQWTDGWKMHEARLDLPEMVEMEEYRTNIERWQGQPVENLFVWMEQGAGDRIQILRFIPTAARMAATLWLRDHTGMKELAALGAPEWPVNIEWIMPGETRQAQGTQLQWIPSLSLPSFYRDRWFAPYLRQTAEPTSGKIGLCCFGNRNNKLDSVRSLSIEAAHRLRNLLVMAGYRVHSLHGSDNADRWFAASGEQTPPNRVNRWRDLVDEISGCESIVTVDSAVAHIAGALGKATHLLTYEPSDWRWMTGPVSEWYPTIKIHRRPIDREWEMAVSSLMSSLPFFPPPSHTLLDFSVEPA